MVSVKYGEINVETAISGLGMLLGQVCKVC